MHDSDTAKVYIIRKERRNEFVISLRGNIKMRSFSFFFFFSYFHLQTSGGASVSMRDELK